MLSIGWVIFWKALILAVWGDIQEMREAKREGRRSDAFGSILYEEWKRRTAKQPLALTDARSDPLE